MGSSYSRKVYLKKKFSYTRPKTNKATYNGTAASTGEKENRKIDIIDSKEIVLGQETSDALLEEYLNQFSDNFNNDPKNRLAFTAISSDDMSKVLLSRETTINNIHVFSEKIELEGKATNQKSSGRCWLFAATNVMRLIVMKKYHLDDFELSQPFLFFYDKLEKANFFLETMIELAGKEPESRLVQYLLHDPVNDGGQWDMVINLLTKYGLVPKAVFPETYHTSNSDKINRLITSKLREFAHRLHTLRASGRSINSIRSTKVKMMEDIYRVLAITIGEPPKKFDWAFRDKDGVYHKYEDLTPKEFYQNFVGYKAQETFSLINDPRNQYMRLYTVEYLGNVQGGSPIRYVNIPIEKMKKLAIKVLRSGKPVWFGADVGKFSNTPLGVLDNKIYDYELAFNITFDLDKTQRLRYGDSLMTHAMVFTGVHLEDKVPVRWRVENSWGKDRGDKGFFVMSDDWFSHWVYQIVLEKKDASKDLLEVLDQTPEVLPAWDPMGSLAKM